MSFETGGASLFLLQNFPVQQTRPLCLGRGGTGWAMKMRELAVRKPGKQA